VPVFKGSTNSQTTQSNTNVPMINVTVINSTCLVLGAMSLLKQFNSECRNQFLAYLTQYVRSAIALNSIQRVSDLPAEVPKLLSFLDDFVELGQLDRKVI
jgi:hypothetical protein